MLTQDRSHATIELQPTKGNSLNKIIAAIAMVMLSMMSFMPGANAQIGDPIPSLAILGVDDNANVGELDYVEVYANNVTNTSQFFDLSIYTNSSSRSLEYRLYIGELVTGWISTREVNNSVGVLLWLSPGEGVMVELASVRNSCATTVGDFVATLDRGFDGVVNDIALTPNCRD